MANGMTGGTRGAGDRQIKTQQTGRMKKMASIARSRNQKRRGA